MRTPWVTIRPLRQINGDAEFNEVFFDNVRVPKANLIGEKNQGWQVAVTRLMFERSSIAAMRDMMSSVDNLVRLAKKLPLQGGCAWNDTGVRQTIAGFACEAAALRYGNLRQLTRRLKGLPPGPEGSVGKLGASDLNLKMAKFAVELLGPYSQFEHGAPQALDNGTWNYRMLAARAFTIAGGTSEIQHNIIGERVLGLPKG
jgi:alkylation response protein AidB-like acyl-CoA dehydrogenase